MNGPLAGVVTVGTDHHRFDRLMDWLERWNAGHPGAVRWVVQHGSSRPMTGADGFAMKPRADLLELLRAADVVVTQGGPGRHHGQPGMRHRPDRRAPAGPAGRGGR